MNIPDHLEKFRIISGVLSSEPNDKRQGFFVIPFESYLISVCASNGELDGWEHVSVSLRQRTPNWKEMCFVKDLFWNPEDCVIQFHPPKSTYVNNHSFCLHLWKQVGKQFEMPNPITVGYKELNETKRGGDENKSSMGHAQ